MNLERTSWRSARRSSNGEKRCLIDRHEMKARRPHPLPPRSSSHPGRSSRWFTEGLLLLAVAYTAILVELAAAIVLAMALETVQPFSAAAWRKVPWHDCILAGVVVVAFLLTVPPLVDG
jgi:hypothetical protein